MIVGDSYRRTARHASWPENRNGSHILDTFGTLAKVIQGTYSAGFRFVLPDGQELKAAPSREEAAPTGPTSVVADMQLAKVALTNLKFKAGEAGDLVSRAREELEARGEACSVEALVKVALQLS